MKRAAVIGLGVMGSRRARLLHEMDGVELVAVADADTQLAATIGRRYAVPWYGDYLSMLDDVGPEVVSVAVPVRVHYQIGMEVLRRGIHLLMEKPIAATVGQGVDLVQQAAAAGATLMVGHVERFNPAVAEMKRRLAAGELGKVFLIHARRLGPLPVRVRDVGVVKDLATHDLDLMRYLLEADVLRIHSETAQKVHTAHEDLLVGLLRFSNDALGVLDINWLTPIRVRELMVTGERGVFLANCLTPELHFFQDCVAPREGTRLEAIAGASQGNMTRIPVEDREPLEAETRAFFQAIDSGRCSGASGEDALAALALAEQLLASGVAHQVTV